MYGTTDDTLGRRLFQIQKEKAVEDALEKIRHRMGTEWNSVSSSDSEVLKEILGKSGHLSTDIDGGPIVSQNYQKMISIH